MPARKTTGLPPGTVKEQIEWMDGQLAEKLDEQLYKSEYRHLQSGISEIKQDLIEVQKLAISAKKRAITHKCSQEDVMVELKAKVDRWDSWAKGFLVTVICSMFGIIATSVYQFAVLKESVQNTKQSMTNLSGTVKSIEKVQTNLQKTVETSEIKRGADLQSIKSTITEAIRDAVNDSDRRPSRRTRGG